MVFRTINKYEKKKYITFRALPPGQLGEKNPHSGEVRANFIMIPKDKSDSIFSAKTGDILIVLGKPIIEGTRDFKNVIFIATSAYKTGTETQHKASASQTQPILENQPKTSRSSQQTQGDKKKTSVSTDISSDTAMRLERERILAMGDARVRQFGMLDKERYDYFNKEDWNAVVAVCKKILEIDPENYAATADIGGAYIGLREFDLAVKYLTKANQLIPAHPLPYANFVYVYAMQGDKERAMEFLQEAVDKGFKDINYLKNDKDLPEDFRNDPRLNNFIK